MSFSQDTLPLFIPVKPEKPLMFCTAQKEWIAAAENFEGWEEVTGLKNLVIKMPYATFDNFSGHNLYCGIQRAFLHKDAMQKLRWASALLKKQEPDYKFILFDAARANHAQEMLRATVRGTPWQHFVSSPSKGSIHAYGMAVDIGLLNEKGELADMGLPYDSFAFYAGKNGEKQALEQGLLTSKQMKNRELLRSVMEQSGWINLPSEWWHFNAAPGDTIRAKYAQPLPLPQ
jgi:D-alanyl-D-alanine dipeptidase